MHYDVQQQHGSKEEEENTVVYAQVMQLCAHHQHAVQWSSHDTIPFQKFKSGTSLVFSGWYRRAVTVVGAAVWQAAQACPIHVKKSRLMQQIAWQINRKKKLQPVRRFVIRLLASFTDTVLYTAHSQCYCSKEGSKYVNKKLKRIQFCHLKLKMYNSAAVSHGASWGVVCLSSQSLTWWFVF